VLDGLTISNGLANGTPVEPNSYGGGVYVSNATLQNCAVTLNRGGSGGYGAGVYGLRSTVKGCTISRNVHVGESWYGGGTAGGLNVTAGYTPVIRNTIAYGNQAAGVAADISDVATQFCGRCCSPDLKEGVNGNISASPRLVSAGSDYGLSHVRGDYELTKNSPCFNTGVTLPWMSGATDLAGKPRLLPTQAPLADMGAFEMIPPPAGNLLIVR
jgi:hypothetical protein